jgi:hypothetical protein
VLLAAAIAALAAAVAATIVVQSGSHTPGARQHRSSAQATRAAGSPGAGLTRPDLGRIWGVAFRGRAATYLPLARVEAETNAIPADASVDRRTNTIRFTGATAGVTIVANPPNGRDMAFRSAGLENPTIDVSRGAVVTVRFINGDSDSAHGWLLLDPIVQVGRSFHGPAHSLTPTRRFSATRRAEASRWKRSASERRPPEGTATSARCPATPRWACKGCSA